MKEPLLGNPPYGKTKEEHRAYSAWYRNRDLKEYNRKKLEWVRKHRERRRKQSRNSHLKINFGITLEQFNELLHKQDNRCAICNIKCFEMRSKKKRINLVIDHDHKTNKIRGILCHNCNVGLGLLREDVNILKKAIVYLGDRNITMESLCASQ